MRARIGLTSACPTLKVYRFRAGWAGAEGADLAGAAAAGGGAAAWGALLTGAGA
jgi:hypothetical protein